MRYDGLKERAAFLPAWWRWTTYLEHALCWTVTDANRAAHAVESAEPDIIIVLKPDVSHVRIMGTIGFAEPTHEMCELIENPDRGGGVEFDVYPEDP